MQRAMCYVRYKDYIGAFKGMERKWTLLFRVSGVGVRVLLENHLQKMEIDTGTRSIKGFVGIT